MATTDPIANFINQFNLKGVPTLLILGGMASAFILPFFLPKYRMVLGPGGFLAMGAGFYALLTAKATAALGNMINTDGIEHQPYPNPRNDLTNVKPENRFDLQTNYVLSGKNNTFDNYINNQIISEINKMGGGLNSTYPVKLSPYEIKQLLPTTQIDPSMDFNTVRVM